MPAIPSSGPPGTALFEFFAHIESPRDEKERERLRRAMHGIALGQAFLRNEIPEESLTREKRALIVNAPSPGEFYQSVSDGMDEYSSDVGDILLTVLALSEHHPALASVNNAVQLQIWRRANAGKQPGSHAHLMRKWSQLKPVSHFLAAMQMGCMRDRPSAFQGLWSINDGQNLKFNADVFENIRLDPMSFVRVLFALLDWAEISEQLLKWAKKTYAHGQKIPLLTEEEAWFFGPEMPLPERKFQLCPVSKGEQNFLLT